MLKKILLLSLLLVGLLISGCWSEEAEPVIELEKNLEQIETVIEPEIEEIEGEKVNNSIGEVVVEPIKVSCIDNNECEWGKKCIDGVCKTIAELYDTDCEYKCNFNSVIVKTSDKEFYTLNRGKSAYTAAGALAWKLLSGPDYCPGDEIIVPIEIEKLSLGKIINKQIVTVNKGEVSEIIKHPKIKSINFILEITDLNEVCS